MKPKFTPGPWKVGGIIQNSKYETHGYAIDYFPPDRDGFETVATTYNAKSGQDLANAALIAAAPEMYEALVSLSNAYRALKVTQGGFFDDSYREAQNALAKARGEE